MKSDRKINNQSPKAFPLNLWECRRASSYIAQTPASTRWPNPWRQSCGSLERPVFSFCLSHPHACQFPGVQQPSVPLVKEALASLFLNRTDYRWRFWSLPCHSRLFNTTASSTGKGKRWVSFSERLWPTQDQKKKHGRFSNYPLSPQTMNEWQMFSQITILSWHLLLFILSSKRTEKNDIGGKKH